MVKHKTKELIVQKEQLLEAQKIANIGHWEWDIRKNTMQWSNEIYRIFGLSSLITKVNYETFLNTVHPDDREYVTKNVNNALYHKQAYEVEHRIVLPDNSEKFIREQGVVQFDRQGKAVKMLGTTLDITKQKSIETQLKHLSEHDPLTGLPNRRQLVSDFEHESKRALRYKENMGLFYIDLNKFKNINDTLGHQVGDQLLQTISEKIRDTLRGNETIYRVGGDEFCVLAPEFKNKDELINLAERIIKNISDIEDFNFINVNLGCSIGIAIFPENGKELPDLLSTADRAMYSIKQSDNKSDFCFVND